jgi:8-oxo-dGTP pyrophosphatase MutT (NUDIX family)
MHAAFVLLTDPQGRILLLHDAYDEGRAHAGEAFYWWIPGGHLDHGDRPANGVLRELAEETGLQPAALSFLGSEFRDPSGHWPALTTYFFTAPALTQEQTAAVRLSEEHDTFCFASPSQFAELIHPSRLDTLLALTKARTSGTTCALDNGIPM